MAFEQRDNSGALFKNDRKERDNHPDYTGNAMIDGREYWISAWLKDGAKGKFFSFAFKPKDEQPRRQEPQRQQRRPDPISSGYPNSPHQPVIPNRDDMDDSIPF